MSLSEKYGIPQQAVKALIKDGWISCSAPQYEEVYYYYKEQRKVVGAVDARINTSVKFNICEKTVYNICKKFE